MGCCLMSKLPTDSDGRQAMDDKQLLQDQNLKYDFIAEYNTTLDSTVDYQETVSRRHSVSISIANIQQLQNYRIKHNKQQPKIIKEDTKNNDDDFEIKYDGIKDENVFIKKFFKNDEWNSLSFRREAKILSTISHNNIIKYITSYQDDSAYYLVLEYCDNGTLIDYIYSKYNNNDNYTYNELFIHELGNNLLSAISYIHKLNIVHRNICLENILISSSNGNKYKLIGWDDSEIIDDKNIVYNDFVGSNIYYLSPEINEIRHGWQLKKIDIFAIGVCLYLLSFGCVPFTGIHHKNICKKIKNGQINWPSNNSWNQYISLSLKKLLQSMLCSYSYSRISANDALLLPFLSSSNNQIIKDNNLDNKPLINDVPYKLYCYQSSMKIRRLLIDHECNEWTQFEQSELINCLKQIFNNNNNKQKEKINPLDVENLLIKMGLNKHDSERKTKQLFLIMDPSSTGHIKMSKYNYKSKNHQRIHSLSNQKDFQYSPIATTQIQNNNDRQIVSTQMIVLDDDIEDDDISDLE